METFGRGRLETSERKGLEKVGTAAIILINSGINSGYRDALLLEIHVRIVRFFCHNLVVAASILIINYSHKLAVKTYKTSVHK